MNRKLKALLASIATAALAAGLALVAPSGAQADQPTYYPSGAQANVSLSTVTSGGWTLCWAEAYNDSSNMNDVLQGTDNNSAAPCNGSDTLMTGWANSDPENLVTLAAAPTADVFTETPISDDNGDPYPKLADGWNSYPWSPGNIHSNPHEVNGTYWYYTPGISMGFTPTRDLDQWPGDSMWSDGTQPLRLSWHMYDGSQPYSVNGGYSLGEHGGLNGSADFTRAIFTSGAQVTTSSGLDVSAYTFGETNTPERQPYTPCDGSWTHVNDISVDFEAQFGSVVAGCQTDYVLVHYKGFVTFPDSGTYAFQALADDGFWMSLDSTPVITDDWVIKAQSGNIYPDVQIVGGHPYAFDAWFYEWGGGANINMTYSPDNGSTWSTIPASFYTRSAPGLNVNVYSFDGGGSQPERQAYTPCEGAWTHVDDISVDFEAQFGSVVAGCQTDYVLVHYKGFVTFPDSGTYAFQALADDGFWMSLDSTPVITGDWREKAGWGIVYPDVSIVGGHTYAFDAWFYEYGGGANINLTYSPDNGSTWLTVPASFFTRVAAGAEVAAAPTVSLVSPSTGSTAGGTSLTITGTGFVSGATVTVGGAACTDVAFVSATSLTCASPAGNEGAADVVVTNPDAQKVTQTGAFTYQIPVVNPTITGVTPSSGPTTGNRWITIKGTDFVNGATVTVGGAACSPNIFLSATTLTCLIPGGSAGAKDVVVTNPDNGTVTSVGGYTYGAAVVTSKYLASRSKNFKLSFVAVAKLLQVTKKAKGSLKVTVAKSSRLVCKVSGTYLKGLKKAGTCAFTVKSYDSRKHLVKSKSGKFKTR